MLKSFQKQAFFELCDELLKKGNELTFTVVSDCMKHQIEPGDEIKVRYAHPFEIAFGDIVIYKSQEGFITHRIIGKRFADGRKVFLHKGDNSRHAATIPAEQVIAKAVSIKKADKRIRLDTIRGRLVNYIFGFRSILSVFIRQKCSCKFTRLLRNCFKMTD
jgi:signal peptidase I